MKFQIHNSKNLLLLFSAALNFFSSPVYAQIERGSYLVTTAPLRTHNIADVKRVAAKNPKFGQEFSEAYSRGFRPMMNNWGGQDYKPLAIVIQRDSLNAPAARSFRNALVTEKRKLMELYSLRNDTYNKFAAMALAIFGNESKFGTSVKYAIKEQNQGLVIALKALSGDASPTPSRGGTQIKAIPEKIIKAYPQIDPDTLAQPKHAAVATVGYLAETFSMLLQRSRNDRLNGIVGRSPLTYIQPENVFDYIPYVYSGQMSKLLRGPKGSEGATVIDNEYIQGMKRNMANFYFMEKNL